MVIFNFLKAPHSRVCIRHLSPVTTNHQQNTQRLAKSEGTFCWNFNSQFPLKAVELFYNNDAKQQLGRKISGAQQPVFLKTVRPCWIYQMSCCFSPHPSGSCAALKFLFLSINFVERWCFRLSFLSFPVSFSIHFSSVQRGFIGMQVSIKILRKHQNIICLSAEECVCVSRSVRYALLLGRF